MIYLSSIIKTFNSSSSLKCQGTAWTFWHIYQNGKTENIQCFSHSEKYKLQQVKLVETARKLKSNSNIASFLRPIISLCFLPGFSLFRLLLFLKYPFDLPECCCGYWHFAFEEPHREKQLLLWYVERPCRDGENY